MKRVVLVHGWSGTPETGWFPWLKENLELRGFKVIAPQLPDTSTPRINAWVPALIDAVGIADEETYFIGHSMGCQTIIRYIETLPQGTQVGGAVFIAGFFRPLTNIDESEKEIDREWATTPIDTNKVRSALRKSVAVFSDNDNWVPVENAEDFKSKLGSEIIIEHAKEHFHEGGGFEELPIALKKLLELAEYRNAQGQTSV